MTLHLCSSVLAKAMHQCILEFLASWDADDSPSGMDADAQTVAVYSRVQLLGTEWHASHVLSERHSLAAYYGLLWIWECKTLWLLILIYYYLKYPLLRHHVIAYTSVWRLTLRDRRVERKRLLCGITGGIGDAVGYRTEGGSGASFRQGAPKDQTNKLPDKLRCLALQKQCLITAPCNSIT